jgi:predicted HTH domain antitoxin
MKSKEKHMRICELYIAGKSYSEIVKELGLGSTGSISYALKKASISTSRVKHTVPADEIAVVRKMFNDGDELTEIAKKLSRGVGFVRKVLGQLGLLSARRDALKERDSMIVSLYQSGVSTSEIAERVGRMVTLVRHVLQRAGVPLRNELSDEQREMVCSLYDSRVALSEIYSQTNLSKHLVDCALWGRRQRNTVRYSSSSERFRTLRARKYGLSLQEFDQLMIDANYACMVCGSSSKLCIDHSHKTGSVRGVLCGRCNSAAGFAEDDPNRLRLLADYLGRKE